ncbi:hypothetical protein CSKR_200184 [Clonorchis sinensis]|uniref:Uncharacterized protein n=1 Tax=Clonorchis sinensis TaxID=79923 RepID=A0A3R7GDR1_CLOSI|nr:hypothetical protein CSKR_200184 [Clonorchis sinensis]
MIRLLNKSWLYGSEASVLNTDVMLSMMMMVMSVLLVSNPRQPSSRVSAAHTPFRCLTAMLPEGSARAGILPICPSLDWGSREAEVGFEPRTFLSYLLNADLELEMAQWLMCEPADRKFHGSLPTLASWLLLYGLGKPGSNSVLVLFSGRMAARYNRMTIIIIILLPLTFVDLTAFEAVNGSGGNIRSKMLRCTRWYSGKLIRPQWINWSHSTTWRKPRGGQRMTWQKGVKEITKSLGVVGVVRLPGWVPRVPTCSWLEILQEMAANRCQWRSCCPFLSRLRTLWLYGSEASVSTLMLLSLMMMMMMNRLAVSRGLGARQQQWFDFFVNSKQGRDGSIRDSNLTSASRLPLSRLGLPGSISAVVFPSGGMTARHRKDGYAPEGVNRSAVAPFRRLTALPPEGSTRAEILPGCPSLGRGSRDAETEFEPRTFRPSVAKAFVRTCNNGTFLSLVLVPSKDNHKVHNFTVRRHLDCSCLGLGNLAVSQPSCLFLLAWQLGAERVLRLSDYLFILSYNLKEAQGLRHCQVVQNRNSRVAQIGFEPRTPTSELPRARCLTVN